MSDYFNHTSQHLKNTNHSVFLNLKEVLLEDQSKEDEKGKVIITKLAIGKPGGIDLETEKWELVSKVICLSCDKSFDPKLSEKLSKITSYVINSSSESEKSDIKAWEVEVKPCKHTNSLVQQKEVKILSKDEATCNNCNLNSNLWLCLTCGNLGCGRKQVGGQEGNGHGLEHFEKTGHPLSLKTGTITPQGDACKL
jgi:ubiquitin carboxyl-terminal hydrolase 5/13